MGMYTELHYNTALKVDVPNNVLDVLRYMLGETEEKPEIPEHDLFNTTRWPNMLRSDSYYFDGDTHSTLRHDDNTDTHYLCVRCNLKNYDDEIFLFVNWIRPYIDKNPGDFLGFSRYEEAVTPDLIYA